MSQTNGDERDKKIRELYRYDEMSNKVLRADRSLHSQRSDPMKDAAQSQPKSMVGRISVKEMGQLVKPEATSAEKETYRKEVDGRKSAFKNRSTKEKRNFTNSTILSGDGMQKLNYFPSDESNARYYDTIVQMVAELLGDDIPHDVILSATDYVLQVLKGKKNEEGTDMDTKMAKIQDILSVPISNSQFREIVESSKQISDFHQSEQIDDINEDGVAILASDEELGDNDNDNALMNELEESEVEEELQENSDQRLEHNTSTILVGDTNGTDDTVTLSLAGRDAGDTVENIPIYNVDELYLFRLISSKLDKKDQEDIQTLCNKLMEILGSESSTSNMESKLAEHIDLRHHTLIKMLSKNSASIFWGTQISGASVQRRAQLLEVMLLLNLNDLVHEYEDRETNHKRKLISDVPNGIHVEDTRPRKQKKATIPNTVNLQDLAFDQGSELLSTTRVMLPTDSFKRVKDSYEEIHIPAPTRPSEDFKLVPITDLPIWARDAFPSSETTHLNRIQSEVFPSAFGNDNNMLICAPTGSGKTNIAMLTVLRTLSHHLDSNTGTFDLKRFKMVYIAPLKALVQEQVREFQRRLAAFGIKVEELTGDSSLTRQQIAQSTMLVSTPEKWDIITRKKDSTMVDLVELLIIDEVHLLHDERGPVLESIVARSLRNTRSAGKLRIVALSATLPNYADVGRFLRVPQENLFYFDSSFRPCPLAQQFCGVTETNGMKRVNAMNQACYDKLLEVVKQGHQAIVFVHSRKDTARTALWIKQKLVEEDKLIHFVKSEPGSKEIVRREADNVSDKCLAELFQFGFGLHHAGLTKSDRSLSEDLFADGLLSVLVSTATLAWGVNLPAHAVIIKGTDIYSPEKGTWTRLSPQDVLQMLGRAGRPRYDTFGEGIIITQQSSIQYYLAMLNQQLPIESQLMAKLADTINSEVVLGNIKSRKEAVDWIGFTYLFVRMLESPDLYKVPSDRGDDDFLYQYRDELAHSAFELLHNNSLVVYDANNGSIYPTELGKIASYFYIKFHSISLYNRMLTEHLTSIEILRIFSRSDEFKYIPVRQEEKVELQKLLEKAPIPVQESVDDPMAKINILLQTYISRTKLDGFALKSDMLYITQSAGRLMRALYEVSVKKGIPMLAKALLTLCKSIERRMWITNSPLRQFKSCPMEVIRHTEASFLPWQDYFHLSSPREVGDAVRSEKYGKLVYDLLKKFPRLSLNCSVQPLTPSVLHFDLEISPKWTWDSKVHGFSEKFVVLVENEMGDKLLYTDALTVKERYANEEHFLDFTIILNTIQQQALPSNFFVSLVSERWILSEVKIPILLEEIRLPKKFPAPTPLLDLQKVPTSELNSEEFMKALNFTHFNKIQSQVFSTLYDSNDNIFIGAATGSGKVTMAELTLFNLWRQAGGRSIYICPSQQKINYLSEAWSSRFSDLAGGKIINKFDDDNINNLRLLAKSHLILCTPEQFDVASRRWKQRRNIQNISLLIFDEVHMVGNSISGAIYENIVSRMNFITAQLETDLRVVGIANSVANSREFGQWMGVKKENIHNFSPTDRELPLQIKFQIADQQTVPSVVHEILQPIFVDSLQSTHTDQPVAIFASSKHHCMEIVAELIKIGTERIQKPVHLDYESLKRSGALLSSKILKEAINWKIGVLSRDTNVKDRYTIERLYKDGHLKMLIVARDADFSGLKSNVAVLLGTSYYEVKEHRFVDYTVNEVQKMLSVAALSPKLNKALIITSTKKKEYYKKFLSEPLPVESFMYYHLPDAISNEVSTGVIETKQDCIDWLTFTLYYRRIHGNPSYYGVKDVSPMGISAYLTEVVDEVIKDLVNYSMIEVETDKDMQDVNSDDEQDSPLIPLNGCLISSHYNTSFTSMQVFHQFLSKASGLRSFLEALASTSELESLAIRESDVDVLKSLYSKIPVKSTKITNFESSAFKAFVLLQSHFSRLQLRNELQLDMDFILRKAPALVNSMVDFMAGEGHLNATIAMDLSQMLVQGVWDTDSPLLQVPYFDFDMVEKCKARKVETVYDIMALEDDERDELLTFNVEQLASIANFVNMYPNIELAYSIEESAEKKVGEPLKISVTLTRDEEPESLRVISERLPYAKNESWWIVAGETATKELYSIKKVSLAKESQTYDLEVTLQEEGNHTLTLWCVSDAYVDADKEVSFGICVQ
ncbi:LANO_0C05798g1_1 [Lachancea nothofagi CBS 11611]|uniref:U5 small nuclear ribonucleoprotein 200 kDa helicase n=1 Tax=Lachancea nothofagi CBS 11611 TaxID=1266666 RepID=A0A1G4J7I6_9SACH|nr:LANO_0C05798g1_1 [Lachancea nothofagi CBS 11611]